MVTPAKPKAKLAWLVDGELLCDLATGPNRVAAEDVVSALRNLGRLEQVDAGDVTAVVMLAEAVDNDATNAALWGQYRAALAVLRASGQAADASPIETLIKQLAGDTDIRDTSKPKQAHKRNPGRKGGADAGPAADAAPAADSGRSRRTAAGRNPSVS